MMDILDVKDLEDCFDSSFMKEVLLDSCISKEFIFYLGNEGDLQYFPTFARPFFKIEVPGKYIIKGVQGNNTMRLILNPDTINNSLSQFIKNVVQFKPKKEK